MQTHPAQEHPGVDAFLDDNLRELGLVCVAERGEGAHKLVDFEVSHCVHIAISHAVTEHNDVAGEHVVGLKQSLYV
jgi:hypothetical protein